MLHASNLLSDRYILPGKCLKCPWGYRMNFLSFQLNYLFLTALSGWRRNMYIILIFSVHIFFFQVVYLMVFHSAGTAFIESLEEYPSKYLPTIWRFFWTQKYFVRLKQGRSRTLEKTFRTSMTSLTWDDGIYGRATHQSIPFQWKFFHLETSLKGGVLKVCQQLASRADKL